MALVDGMTSPARVLTAAHEGAEPPKRSGPPPARRHRYPIEPDAQRLHLTLKRVNGCALRVFEAHSVGIGRRGATATGLEIGYQ